jgi:hypothetical protein
MMKTGHTAAGMEVRRITLAPYWLMVPMTEGFDYA